MTPVLSERTGVSIWQVFDAFFEQDITFHNGQLRGYHIGGKVIEKYHNGAVSLLFGLLQNGRRYFSFD
jgi:hypothetical protein